MKTFIYSILFLILHGSQMTFGQNKNDGKLAITIENIDSLTHTPKSEIKGYLFCSGSIVAQINFDSLLSSFSNKQNVLDKIRYYMWLPENHYTLLIENVLDVPIIFTEIVIRKKKMAFLSIDFKKIGQKVGVLNSAIILNYHNEFIEEMRKIYPNYSD